MLGGDRAEGDAHDGVRARGEDVHPAVTDRLAVGAADVVRKGESHPVALADPVGLHRAHALGPARHPGQVVEQLVGVVGDPQVVHRDLALLDRCARAPAASVDHLLVREHRLVDRVPVDHAGLLVGDPLLQHPEEEPLVPLVVRGVAGREFARPVDREPDRLHLPLHRGDVVVRPLGRRDAALHRRVLGGQAEGVPAHRRQHVVPLHPHVPVHHVADRVVAHVPHVQDAGGVGQHRHAVEFLPLRALDGAVRVDGLPLRLRGRLDFGVVIGFHGGATGASGARPTLVERQLYRRAQRVPQGHRPSDSGASSA